MLPCTVACALMLMLPQPRGSGWEVPQARPDEVRMIYWELLQTTEIEVRLIPSDPDGKPPLVNLVFRAFFPGRAGRNPYTGLPRWPKGTPARLTLTAEPLPMTLIRELSLQLRIDGRTLDLTGSGMRYRNVPCLVCDADCCPNGVEAELDPAVLRSLVRAQAGGGRALGFPFTLTADDQRALADFTFKVGLSPDDVPKR